MSATREHSGDQIAQIAGLIAEFGFVNPVLIGADDIIIAGHDTQRCAEIRPHNQRKICSDCTCLCGDWLPHSPQRMR